MSIYSAAMMATRSNSSQSAAPYGPVAGSCVARGAEAEPLAGQPQPVGGKALQLLLYWEGCG
jgi:hypothetical protein